MNQSTRSPIRQLNPFKPNIFNQINRSPSQIHLKSTTKSLLKKHTNIIKACST